MIPATLLAVHLTASQVGPLSPEERATACPSMLMGATVHQGELVVAGFRGGACRFDGQAWHRVEGLPTDMLNDVLADGETLWWATSEGLVRQVGADLEVMPLHTAKTAPGAPATHHRQVSGLAMGERMWVSDVVGPISVSRGGRWRRHRRSVWGTSHQDVAACGSDAWVASEDAGVSHFDGRRWRHHDAETGLPDDWIMAVACDGDGQAWAGTYQDGLWAWDGLEWSRVPGLPEDWIQALAWGPEGLWVGTMTGLFHVGEAGVQRVEGLPHASVHDIERVDGQGGADEKLLVSTEGGLAVFAL